MCMCVWCGEYCSVWPAACGEGEKSKQTARPAYVMSSGHRGPSTVVGDDEARAVAEAEAPHDSLVALQF